MEAINTKSYIFVTGGAGGIGSAICRLLPSLNLTPIVGFNTNAAQARVLAKELKGFAVQIDMGDSKSIENAIQFIGDKIESSGSLYGVVLGASPPPVLEPFLKVSHDQFTHQFNVNVIGSHLLLKALIKNFFKKNKAGIIIGILTEAIGSQEQPPSTGMGSYIVAKAALKSLLSICSVEHSWLKVRTVSPGFTKTPMLDVFDPRYLEIIQAKKKISMPEKVAKQIIELIES